MGICDEILKAPGRRAYTIYRIKQEGWWYQNNKDTCDAIRKSPDCQAFIIAMAKKTKWWVD